MIKSIIGFFKYIRSMWNTSYNDAEEVDFQKTLTRMRNEINSAPSFEEFVSYENEISELINLIENEKLTIFSQNDIKNWEIETKSNAENLLSRIFNHSYLEEIDSKIFNFLNLRKIFDTTFDIVDICHQTDCLAFNSNVFKIIEIYDKIKNIDSIKELQNRNLIEINHGENWFGHVRKIARRSVLNSFTQNEFGSSPKEEIKILTDSLDKIRRLRKH